MEKSNSCGPKLIENAKLITWPFQCLSPFICLDQQKTIKIDGNQVKMTPFFLCDPDLKIRITHRMFWNKKRFHMKSMKNKNVVGKYFCVNLIQSCTFKSIKIIYYPCQAHQKSSLLFLNIVIKNFHWKTINFLNRMGKKIFHRMIWNIKKFHIKLYKNVSQILHFKSIENTF